MKNLASSYILLFILLIPLDLMAASYDICGTLRYWDHRTRHSNQAGSKVQGSNSTPEDRPARRVKLYLYDQDGCKDLEPGCFDIVYGTNLDDLLATTYSGSSTGEYCFTGIGENEDVYILSKFESDDTEVKNTADNYTAIFSHTIDNFGTPNPWNPYGGDLTMNWNTSCPARTTGWCSSSTYVVTDFARKSAILQSAVDVDVLVSPDSHFHPNGHSSRIRLYDGNGPGCNGGTKSISCDEVCISNTNATNNAVIAHEIGHNLMKRMLDVCTSLSGSDPACSNHAFASSENEKCATSEGFATFVAAATIFEPWEDGAWGLSPSWEMEGLTEDGNSFVYKRCVSFGNDAHTREGNVARFFWDLYDSTALYDSYGGYYDNQSWNFNSILKTWDYLPSGTSNRRAEESDLDGRNVWDFTYYAPGAEGEITVNCLNVQDYN